MNIEKQIVGAMEEGNAYKAFACALDRVAMEPNSLEAKACMALALYAHEKPIMSCRMAVEIVEKDPGNEIARMVLILGGPAILEDAKAWNERPEGFVLKSKWFHLLQKLELYDEAEKYAFQMSQDESPVARADFLENVTPCYHDKAAEHERKMRDMKEKEEKSKEERKEPEAEKKAVARKRRRKRPGGDP